MTLRLLLLGMLLYSCSSQRMVQTDLYFGRLKPNGDTVSEQQWNDFVAGHVCRVFTQGSTIIRVSGNWYDTTQKRLLSEPSYMVIAITKLSPKLSRQIDSLRAQYIQLHQQQSVLRVDRKVKVKF